MTRCTWPPGCSQDAAADGELCYYHGKAADGLLTHTPVRFGQGLERIRMPRALADRAERVRRRYEAQLARQPG